MDGRLQKTPVVELLDPFQPGIFHFCQAAPGTKPVNHVGRVQADDEIGEDVDNEGRLDKARQGGVVGEIGSPDLIGPFGVEPSL